MNSEETSLFIKIKSIVSGGIGQNHALTGDVSLQNCLGIRKVQISIVHEANATKEGNMDRIKEDMAPIAQQIVSNLSSFGYSVTETKNFAHYIGQNDRGVLLIRCSLNTILKKESSPPESSTVDLVIDTDSKSIINLEM